MPRKKLKVIKLIEPDLCLDCRFARIATVKMSDESTRRMIHCKRLDCDNWDFQDVEAADSVLDSKDFEGEAA